MRICKLCQNELRGRRDKMFCSLNCKNEYHFQLRRVTNIATLHVDKILHRNRSILLEIMGKNFSQKKIYRLLLDRKKFNFGYTTGFHINKNGKTVHHVYDFSWLIFSDEEVLIKRKRTNKDTQQIVNRRK